MIWLLGMTAGTANLLWLIAAILVIWGLVYVFRGAILSGIMLIVFGALVGPGGISIFK
jgi:hypothetical protein